MQGTAGLDPPIGTIGNHIPLVRGSGAGDEPMRVAVEVLGGEFVKLGVLERVHLMDEAGRDVHALAGREFELFNCGRLRRRFDLHFETAGAQVEGLGLELVEMQRTAFALPDFEDLAAIEAAVGDPDLAAPAFRHDADGRARARRFRGRGFGVFLDSARIRHSDVPPGYEMAAAGRADRDEVLWLSVTRSSVARGLD